MLTPVWSVVIAPGWGGTGGAALADERNGANASEGVGALADNIGDTATAAGDWLAGGVASDGG
jgi:hypothetical protein